MGDWFTIRDGVITEVRSSYDPSEVRKLLG